MSRSGESCAWCLLGAVEVEGGKVEEDEAEETVTEGI